MFTFRDWTYEEFPLGGVQQYISGRLCHSDSYVASPVFTESKCLRYLDSSTPGISDRTLILDCN
jgi:hypothetical protein